MKRCGEFVLSCAALEIVAALGIRSLQSAAVIHLGPRRTGTEPSGLVGNLVRIGRDGFEIRTPLRVRRQS